MSSEKGICREAWNDVLSRTAILMSNAFIPGVGSYGSMPIATVLVRM
jgi:hypothetical protein